MALGDEATNGHEALISNNEWIEQLVSEPGAKILRGCHVRWDHFTHSTQYCTSDVMLTVTEIEELDL